MPREWFILKPRSSSTFPLLIIFMAFVILRLSNGSKVTELYITTDTDNITTTWCKPSFKAVVEVLTCDYGDLKPEVHLVKSNKDEIELSNVSKLVFSAETLKLLRLRKISSIDIGTLFPLQMPRIDSLSISHSNVSNLIIQSKTLSLALSDINTLGGEMDKFLILDCTVSLVTSLKVTKSNFKSMVFGIEGSTFQNTNINKIGENGIGITQNVELKLTNVVIGQISSHGIHIAGILKTVHCHFEDLKVDSLEMSGTGKLDLQNVMSPNGVVSMILEKVNEDYEPSRLMFYRISLATDIWPIIVAIILGAVVGIITLFGIHYLTKTLNNKFTNLDSVNRKHDKISESEELYTNLEDILKQEKGKTCKSTETNSVPNAYVSHPTVRMDDSYDTDDFDDENYETLENCCVMTDPVYSDESKVDILLNPSKQQLFTPNKQPKVSYFQNNKEAKCNVDHGRRTSESSQGDYDSPENLSKSDSEANTMGNQKVTMEQLNQFLKTSNNTKNTIDHDEDYLPPISNKQNVMNTAEIKPPVPVRSKKGSLANSPTLVVDTKHNPRNKVPQFNRSIRNLPLPPPPPE